MEEDKEDNIIIEDTVGPNTSSSSGAKPDGVSKTDTLQEDMITCPNCSAKNPKGSTVCFWCKKFFPAEVSRLIYVFFKKIMETLSVYGIKNIQNAIKNFVSSPINVNINSSNFLDTTLIPEKIGGYDTPIVALLSETKDELRLRNCILLSFPDAKKLSECLMGGVVGDDNSFGIEISSLKEFSNIITASFVNVLSNIIHTKILCSTSIYVNDTIGQIIDFTLFNYPQAKGKTFFVSFEIHHNNNVIPFILMVIFSEKDLEFMMQKSLEELKTMMSQKADNNTINTNSDKKK